MSWLTEVQAIEGDWASNSLRFATEQEAKDYGKELLSRWFGAKDSRAVESNDPVNYKFDWTNGAKPTTPTINVVRLS